MQRQQHQQEDYSSFLPPPPPYDPQPNEIYLSEMDSTAWPSSYYGRTRRIDLAKFYFDILKASGDEKIRDNHHQQQQHCDDTCTNSTYSNSSSDDEGQFYSTQKPKPTKKMVTFSEAPPTVYEYEPEYEKSGATYYTSSSNMTYSHTPSSYKNSALFDEGWPGRTKKAMASAVFIDFKSKIEAKLGAVNDPSLLAALDQNNESMLNFAETEKEQKEEKENDNKDISTMNSNGSLLYENSNSNSNSNSSSSNNNNGNNNNNNTDEIGSFHDSRGYYRHRKSPLVQTLYLQPILNPQCVASFETSEPMSANDDNGDDNDDPGLLTDITPSPSNSCTDSPITPRENCQDLLLVPHIVTVRPQSDVTTTTTVLIDGSATSDSASSPSSSSLLSRKNSGKWLRSLSLRMRNGGSTKKAAKIKS